MLNIVAFQDVNVNSDTVVSCPTNVSTVAPSGQTDHFYLLPLLMR